MTRNQAENFAEALTNLCNDHGVMLWTAYATTPIMITKVGNDTPFKYEVEWNGRDNVSLKRVLT